MAIARTTLLRQFLDVPALTGDTLTATCPQPGRIDLFGAGMLAEHDLRLHHLQLEHVNGTLVGSGWQDLGGRQPHQSGCAISLSRASVGNLHADSDHCSLSWSHS